MATTWMVDEEASLISPSFEAAFAFSQSVGFRFDLVIASCGLEGRVSERDNCRYKKLFDCLCAMECHRWSIWKCPGAFFFITYIYTFFFVTVIRISLFVFSFAFAAARTYDDGRMLSNNFISFAQNENNMRNVNKTRDKYRRNEATEAFGP